MAIDPQELRSGLGNFTTGVTVITCFRDDYTPHGLTANAFTAVSLRPPLILVALDRSSTMCSLMGSAPFTVNVLRSEQLDLAMHFAGHPNQDVDWETDSDCGAPRLAGCLAYVSCRPWQSYDGGDHVLYLGEVQDLHVDEGRPLLFHASRFHALGHSLDLAR